MGSFKILAVAVSIYLVSRAVTGFLPATAPTTQSNAVAVESFIVPPTTERSIVFTDRGRTFRVGAQSGGVVYFDDHATPQPAAKK